MSEKDVDEIKEPNLEDLDEDDLEDSETPSDEEEEKEEVETESLEARFLNCTKIAVESRRQTQKNKCSE